MTVRMLKCGKLGLRSRVKGGGTFFAVGKSGGKQREVFHGTRVSEACTEPPALPYLAKPSAFTSIEFGAGQLLRTTKRDERCSFNQL